MTLPLINGRRYGYQKAKPDHRAFGLASVPGLKLAPLPSSDLHLSQFMQPVKDQGQLGACTAFCGAGDREAIASQYEGKIITLSPLFLYYVEREIDGTLNDGDCGSTGRTSCQAINSYGICPEPEDVYDINNYMVEPTPNQIADAIPYKAGAYHSLFTLEDIKTCIISGYRVRIGMNVYQSFEDTGSDGLVAVPDPSSEMLLGGHEVLAWGYDDAVVCPGSALGGAVRFRNSWGPDWGLGGDFWLSYDALIGNALQADFKIQHLGGPWKPMAISA